jgi:hypothetical protein
MPVVHRAKRRAKHYSDKAAKGGGWYPNTTCSRFVLGLLALGLFASSAVQVEVDLTTVICHEPSVSRECGTHAKLQHHADGYSTICWRPFEQT